MSKQNASTGRGFAGIRSLGKAVEVPKTQESAESERSNQSATAPEQPAVAYQAPPEGEKGSNAWLGWVGGIIAIIIVINLASKDEPSRPPQAASTTPTYPTTTYEPPAATPPPEDPGIGAESKPPVGTGRALTMSQIRYCVAEDVRIEGANQATDETSQSQIDQFNAMVEDYNLRCSNFRYRAGQLESAQREANRNRAQLRAEGAARIY
jgi:hypothetical protein